MQFVQIKGVAPLVPLPEGIQLIPLVQNNSESNIRLLINTNPPVLQEVCVSKSSNDVETIYSTQLGVPLHSLTTSMPQWLIRPIILKANTDPTNGKLYLVALEKRGDIVVFDETGELKLFQGHLNQICANLLASNSDGTNETLINSIAITDNGILVAFTGSRYLIVQLVCSIQVNGRILVSQLAQWSLWDIVNLKLHRYYDEILYLLPLDNRIIVTFHLSSIMRIFYRPSLPQSPLLTIAKEVRVFESGCDIVAVHLINVTDSLSVICIASSFGHIALFEMTISSSSDKCLESVKKRAIIHAHAGRITGLASVKEVDSILLVSIGEDHVVSTWKLCLPEKIELIHSKFLPSLKPYGIAVVNSSLAVIG